jgi:hypothetical protein
MYLDMNGADDGFATRADPTDRAILEHLGRQQRNGQKN